MIDTTVYDGRKQIVLKQKLILQENPKTQDPFWGNLSSIPFDRNRQISRRIETNMALNFDTSPI